jgi:glycosyltransferase involved in cell wall biosynthesis
VKVAYVLPRYGEEVVGGAEHAIRMIAERLVADAGWEVEVLTTCARDARTWANDYPAGEVEINGVRVHRFRSVSGRHPDFDSFSNKVLLGGEPSRADQERWIEMQGPVCPEVLDAAVASDAAVVIFKPYLYYPTVYGVPKLGERALMHPAAHDEPALRLPILKPVFAECRGFVFNMVGERRLVEQHFDVAHRRQLVLGFGIDTLRGDPAAARATFGFGPTDPYLLSVGRVDENKGSVLLGKWFAAYKDRHPGPLKLVLAGQVVDAPPDHPDIVLAGIVPEQLKWDALAGSMAVVQPSPYESLSLALLEGFAMGRPGIVNAACAATSEHVRRSGGGAAFTGYGSFEVLLDRLLEDPSLCVRFGVRGREYVEKNYRWPVLLGRYTRFLSSAARAAGR